MKLHFDNVKESVLNIKQDKRTECFNFGSDNAEPSLIEALIRMSVTAKNCADRAAKAIYGKSFGEVGKVIVNSKGQSLNEVLRIAGREYAQQNNCYLQISYNANLEYSSIVVVPVTEVRIGKADDKGYSGKFIVYNNWDKSKGGKIMKSDFILYDKYNPDKTVVERQIRKSAENKDKDAKIEDLISDYNGQILHIKKDAAFKYSASDLESAMSEALLEANSQTFRSKGAEKGFLNTKLMTVQPFNDDSQRKEFKKDLNSLRGAENSSEVLLLEANQMTDDLSKAIQLQDLSGSYNDELFEYSDKQAEHNICKAFIVPVMLVSQSDSSFFGNSGESLKEAKMQLWESREEDRDQIEEVFHQLMINFSTPIEGVLRIINPYIDEDEIQEAKNVNKKAQANLKGSVGGVTALIQTIGQVNQGLISKESAVAVIRTIYGFTEAKAKIMIGGFDDEKEGEEVKTIKK